ncbi:transglycosylase SLT domain-containing protein [Aquibacillus rhizosphaerae]|uniref:Transglycosylase SLT domain-containing protein n=1 Tax=Aquibacillus rhizosphaerae TaxID=3051431 RepID=A0ABT7L6P0_9BACI|nr:transglycosylase SLT domain-containing protein [Aquibacillus sp. LR5S19]MDL4841527.1 transglycosylase SLT domain-containing protein [Aquibacillus sp. LR5S19]
MISILKKGTIAFLLVSTIYLYYWFDEHQTEITSLEKENNQLESENTQLLAQATYMDSKSENDNEQLENGYDVWPKLEETANGMVEESDGAFKKSWALYLVKESQNYDIDPFIVYELLKVETGAKFDPELVGPETAYGQAYGMAQFMKNTAPWIADMADLPYEDELLFDPYYSIQLSLVYLDFLHNQYDNWDEALTAYHRGMQGMEQYKEDNGHAKSNYAIRIQTNAEDHQTIALAK